MIFESSKEYISVYEIKNVISGILKKKSFNDVKELIWVKIDILNFLDSFNLLIELILLDNS